MTKIIDLPTTASTDANTFVPVYKNGKTQKVSATALGGGGSGLDLTSTADVATVDGTEYVPLNKPLGTVFRVTVQRILDWMLARANTWTADQTINANLNFAGVARRITGDFSNASIANRVLVQSSVAGNTSFGVMPNGAGVANVALYGSSDLPNAPFAQLVHLGSEVRLFSSFAGTGSYVPITFYTGGLERLRIDPTTGNVLATGGALGYGVGAGGSVVQATSKGTAVTLNKPCGQISMHNESLASGASATFVFSNTYIGPSAGVVIRPSGFTGYAVEVEYSLSATEVVVRVVNRGATRSDAVILIFQVFQGSTT